MASDDFDVVRRMMNDFYAFRRMPGARSRDVWMPPTDVYETRDAVVIKMSVPGIKPTDVRVLFNGDEIVIGGYLAAARETGVVAYHQMEIRNGYFERRAVVRKPVDPDGAAAAYQDGFLWLRVPKAEISVRRVCTIRLDI